MLNPELVFEHLSIAAPYLELIEEFTLTELIDFHFQFRTDNGEITPPVILAFDPKNPAAPTLQEYSTVVGNLKAFVQKYHQKINGFQGLGSAGFTKV